MKKRKKRGLSLKTKIFLTITVLLLVAGGVFFVTPPGKVVLKHTEELWHYCVEKAHFKLEDADVDGHVHTKVETINEVLNLRRGMPIFDIDLNEKKEAVLQLPWIKTVRIERHLPSQILISVTEKKAIAVWQNKKKYLPIDEEGKPIHDNKTVLSNILLVVGEDAPAHTPDLIKALEAYPDIRQQVRSAVRVGKRRWNLYLNDAENGLEIRLPETDIAAALERLQKYNETDQILALDLKVIDLKLSDRLIVRSNETSNGEKNEAKK